MQGEKMGEEEGGGEAILGGEEACNMGNSFGGELAAKFCQ